MHDTAMKFADLFFKSYIQDKTGLKIVDVGSQDVNGSLREVAPAGNQYVGVDFVEAKGVDIVITDPYVLPFEDESVDVVLSSSCFEHSDFFWLVFNEIMRVLKPTGLLYLNVPSNGPVHRYPVDCWRFYPDSGLSLQNWGIRSGYNCVLLESFTGNQGGFEMGGHSGHGWNDFVGVFLKDRAHLMQNGFRILDTYPNFRNGYVLGRKDFLNATGPTQDGVGKQKYDALAGVIGTNDNSGSKLQKIEVLYNQIRHL